MSGRTCLRALMCLGARMCLRALMWQMQARTTPLMGSLNDKWLSMATPSTLSFAMNGTVISDTRIPPDWSNLSTCCRKIRSFRSSLLSLPLVALSFESLHSFCPYVHSSIQSVSSFVLSPFIPSVRPSVLPSVRPAVHPFDRPSVCPSAVCYTRPSVRSLNRPSVS